MVWELRAIKNCCCTSIKTNVSQQFLGVALDCRSSQNQFKWSVIAYIEISQWLRTKLHLWLSFYQVFLLCLYKQQILTNKISVFTYKCLTDWLIGPLAWTSSCRRCCHSKIFSQKNTISNSLNIFSHPATSNSSKKWFRIVMRYFWIL